MGSVKPSETEVTEPLLNLRVAQSAKTMLACSSRRGERGDWRKRTVMTMPPAVPLRCPACVAQGKLPRLKALLGAEAKTWLREGKAFVTNASELFGPDGSMLRWDFEYLLQHLPTTTKYGVHIVREKLLMSHSMRYETCDENLKSASASDDEFPRSASTLLTFREYIAATKRRIREGAGARPYLGIDVFKREHKGDVEGTCRALGPTLRDDLDVLKRPLEAMQAHGELPILSAIHLFVGIAETLYHCHYDLNPNLHFQLSGRKRFIVFPPENWRSLYPFSVHHDYDRRSRVDWDQPDDSRFPEWRHARGMVVELEPCAKS